MSLIRYGRTTQIKAIETQQVRMKKANSKKDERLRVSISTQAEIKSNTPAQDHASL